MEALTLKAERRQAVRKQVKQVRKQGLVPAVLYGHGLEATPLQIDHKTLAKVLAQAGGHQLISLEIGNEKPQMSLARDIQRDVLKRHYIHVDFYAVRMDEKVTTEVPVVLEGEAPAVENLGGILTQGLDMIQIQCLPADLISAIPVPIDDLVNLNDSLSVADLKVPNSITILSDPDSMIVKIEAPRKVEEEVEEGLEEAMPAEPELARRSHADDEDE